MQVLQLVLLLWVKVGFYSGPHFAAFGLNTGRCGVSLRIQSECEKMGTRITPNAGTFSNTRILI